MTLFLCIQDSAQVQIGAQYLQDPNSPYNCIQFGYVNGDEDMDLVYEQGKAKGALVASVFLKAVANPVTSLSLMSSAGKVLLSKSSQLMTLCKTRISRSQELVGTLGDSAVHSILAPAISNCALPNMVVKFVFCNLSPESTLLLASAVQQNGNIRGFTCIGNLADSSELNERVMQMLVFSPSPLQQWNECFLPDEFLKMKAELCKKHMVSQGYANRRKKLEGEMEEMDLEIERCEQDWRNIVAQREHLVEAELQSRMDLFYKALCANEVHASSELRQIVSLEDTYQQKADEMENFAERVQDLEYEWAATRKFEASKRLEEAEQEAIEFQRDVKLRLQQQEREYEERCAANDNFFENEEDACEVLFQTDEYAYFDKSHGVLCEEEEFSMQQHNVIQCCQNEEEFEVLYAEIIHDES